MLRSMGLDARIVTFQAKASAGNAGSDALYARLIEWAWRYFKGAGLSDGPRIDRTDRPPLYFQHQGHSRTIIGVERRGSGASKKEFLLVGLGCMSQMPRLGPATRQPALCPAIYRSILLSHDNRVRRRLPPKTCSSRCLIRRASRWRRHYRSSRSGSIRSSGRQRRSKKSPNTRSSMWRAPSTPRANSKPPRSSSMTRRSACSSSPMGLS